MNYSKAFDEVEHSKLFAKILAADVHPLYARLLLCTYRHQSAQVCWDEKLSAKFGIRNGVRQGAVLSPVLFNLYTNELFKLLEEAGDGGRIRGIFYGLFGYADDLAIVCNTLPGLQRMISITSQYAASHNIVFSTNPIIAKSKTKSMAFGLKNVPV